MLDLSARTALLGWSASGKGVPRHETQQSSVRSGPLRRGPRRRLRDSLLAPQRHRAADAATRTTVSAQTPASSAVGAAVSGEYVVLAAGDIAECSSSGDEVTANLLALSPVPRCSRWETTPTATEPPRSSPAATPRAGAGRRRAPTPPGEPRLQHRQRRGLLRLLRRRGRLPRRRLLLLRLGQLAHHLPELELLGDRRLPDRVGAGAVAVGRPRRPPADVHAGLLAPPAVQLGRARQRRGRRRPVAGPVRLARRRRAQRSRPRLRAVRPPEPRQRPGHRARHTGVRRGAGGAEKRVFKTIVPNSQLRVAGKNGILRLGLSSNSYTWTFIGEGGPAVHVDTGRSYCI